MGGVMTRGAGARIRSLSGGRQSPFIDGGSSVINVLEVLQSWNQWISFS